MKELSEILRAEIAGTGFITFARFMDRALYCPQYGYYEQKKDNIGRAGDFYTSVNIGPLFGEMLAFQFAQWLEEEGKNSSTPELATLQLVEAGAHDGKLAADILSWLKKNRPEIFALLDYVIIEPSEHRRDWQQKTLAEFTGKIRWGGDFSSPDSCPLTPVPFRIIFSNELLDAMPAHRIGWDAKRKEWFEWGVTVEGGQFVWTRTESSHVPHVTSHVPELPPELLDILPDGFTTEISPAAISWWQQAARSLKSGKLMTIDYGLNAEEFFTPERKGGTLRSYLKHHAVSDVLANPGEQDITAHVNFTALKHAGELTGLKTALLETQERFLTRIAEKVWKTPERFSAWNASHTRQFQTLTHPQHLGRAFRVLVQSRLG